MLDLKSAIVITTILLGVLYKILSSAELVVITGNGTTQCLFRTNKQ